MPEERELEKQLKLVAKTGKYIVGRREVMSGIKGSKLLVWSVSAGLPQSILDDSKNLQIPAVRFNGNPVELGRACGIPFRVSVIAVKSAGDADLKAYSNSADYLVSAAPVGASSLTTSPTPTPEEESAKTKKPEENEKPIKKKKAASAKKDKKLDSEEEKKVEKKKSKTEDADEKKAKPKKAKKTTKKSSEDSDEEE